MSPWLERSDNHGFDYLNPVKTLKGFAWKNLFFGLGWMIMPELSNGEYALIHTGNDPGVSTVVRRGKEMLGRA